jgi:hypothetical protein
MSTQGRVTENVRAGGPNGRQILDYSEVSQLLRAGWTQAAVAQKFGVSQGAVALAKSRGHVDGGSSNVKADIPWEVRPEHRGLHLPKMLRAYARQQAGEKVSPLTAPLLEAFVRSLKELDAVVHYEPDVAPFFFRVPRRHGIDRGLVRDPWTADDGKRIPKPRA